MNRFLYRFKQLFRFKEPGVPQIIPRSSHHLSRKYISSNALKVLYRLNSAGYETYLVGGSVREILLKRKPKDFDIATSATPDQVVELFRNSRMIGRRFRLVHVFFQGEIIEVSTFRANTQEPKLEYGPEQSLVIQADNTYGTIEEDAWRRDFTVNSLYYNIADFTVIDFVGGMSDLYNRTIHIIGDPSQRFHEDPVRLLRAIRFAAKLDFKIHPNTESALFELSHLLQHVPAARIFHELLKLFFDGHALVTYKKLRHYKYYDVLFPCSAEAMHERRNKMDEKFILSAMKSIDERFTKNLSLNAGFLFSVLLWPKLQQMLESHREQQHKFFLSLHQAILQVIDVQSATIAIPRRMTAMMRAIWILQYHLVHRRHNRIERILAHRYFRAAYDFLELRAIAGEPVKIYADWWRRYQSASPEQRQKLLDKLSSQREKIVVHREPTA